MFDLVFLGTSALKPTVSRNVTSSLLRRLNQRSWLFDCGEGTQRQLELYRNRRMGDPGNDPGLLSSSCDIDRIFITHLHGDHVYGLPGLVISDSGLSPLPIYGPPGLASFLSSSFRLTAASRIPYRVIELSESLEGQSPDVLYKDRTWDLGLMENCTVKARRIKHSVFTLGYCVQFQDLPGTIHIDHLQPLLQKHVEYLKTRGYSHPNQICRDLKAGKDVPLPDGQVLRASDESLVSPPRRGAKVGILGDTSNPYSMAPLLQDCDVVVHECTLPQEMSPGDAEIEKRGHSTPMMAGTFAQDIHARTLILNHISGRFELELPELRALTRRYCPETEVIVASDFYSYHFDFPRRGREPSHRP